MAKKSKEELPVEIIEPTIIEKGFYENISSSTVLFGNYVNNNRHMPSFFDGVKPAYRRMIYTALTQPDRMVKVATLTGECGGKYSPHNPEALNDVVSELVNAGILDGQGNHGNKTINIDMIDGPAAPRYIEAKMNNTWRKVIEPLIKLVEFEETELGFTAPKYIPTPVPLSLLFSSLGMGIGIRSSIPSFSLKSILEAYKQNNPNLLEPNGNIGMNKKISDLQLLWDTGIGKVNYNFFLEENALSIDGVTRGIMITGDPSYVQMTLTKKLNGDKEKDVQGWIDRGLVIMEDQSSRTTGKKLFFTIKPRQKEVSMEDLKEELELSRNITTTYKIAVTDGEKTRVMGLREWIDNSFKTYSGLALKSIADRLNALDLKEEIVNNSIPVANYILKKPKDSVESISKALNLTEELVSEITKKSISVLMKTDADKEINSINEKRAELKALKVEDFYKDLL